MGKARVIGIKRLDFKPDNGDAIKGYNVYVGEQLEGTYGLEPNRIFVTDDVMDQYLKPVAGDIAKLVSKDVEILYNKRGKAESFKFIAQA